MKTATGRESTSTDRLVRQVGHFTILALWILSGVSPSRVAAEPADGRPLDVRTFGARGDGVADDTAAVHAGIAAAVNSGRTLLIPKGTYLVGKPIRVTAHGLKIVGAGAQHTVLKASAEMDRLLYLRGTGMVISRLTLDANKKAWSFFAFKEPVRTGSFSTTARSLRSPTASPRETVVTGSTSPTATGHGFRFAAAWPTGGVDSA